ncbi:MAG: hypothetical protein KJ000_13610 [Pirellulaceae bacterium]|nr:hypothetical protein [Pirellulaceae bacterium]
MSFQPSLEASSLQHFHAHCCPCSHREHDETGITRRAFLGGAAATSAALSGLTWTSLAQADDADLPAAPPRKSLKVKPILVYSTPTRRPQTSWRNWGGIETEEQAQAEVAKIGQELAELRTNADFPVEFLPLAAVKSARELAAHQDIESADTLLVYAAGGGNGDYNAIGNLGKNTIIFVRYKSGPVYLWYEIVSPRYLRQHTDELAVKGIDNQDVVVDSQDEILWRLRSLGGLKNTVGKRIVAIGGLAGWAQPKEAVEQLVQDRWKLDVQTVGYDDLGKLIREARADQELVKRSKARAAKYLAQPQTVLETEKTYVENAFVLDEVFRRLMREADCGAITVNHCMGTIMPMSETTACMTLSLLNDAGFLAFCESDFVVIPSGLLLADISGLPVFLNDPTYPHDGIITLAHCTAPRKMDGKTLEPTRIMTHFESDYGAAPKVDMRVGQVVTNIIPDFKAERWVGLRGEIVENPFLPICRSQIDIRFHCDSQLLADRMPGFHWMTGYGDYMRELGYALKRIPITWEVLG